jgi:hypothetical protein
VKPQSSARTSRARAGARATAELEANLARGRKAVEWSAYYEEARELARLLTDWSLSLESTHHRFVVTSGGGPGIMEAPTAARMSGWKDDWPQHPAAVRAGSQRYITEGCTSSSILLHAQVLVCVPGQGSGDLPGGFGTLDEMFEILTLMQTEKLEKQIQIILYGTDYWDPIMKLASDGGVGRDQSARYRPGAAREHTRRRFELLKAHLTEHHLTPPSPQEMKAPGSRRRVRSWWGHACQRDADSQYRRNGCRNCRKAPHRRASFRESPLALPHSICCRSARSGEDVDRQLVVLVLVRRLPPGECLGIARGTSGSAPPGQDGRNARAVGHVNLAPAAGVFACF